MEDFCKWSWIYFEWRKTFHTFSHRDNLRWHWMVYRFCWNACYKIVRTAVDMQVSFWSSSIHTLIEHILGSRVESSTSSSSSSARYHFVNGNKFILHSSWRNIDPCAARTGIATKYAPPILDVCMHDVVYALVKGRLLLELNVISSRSIMAHFVLWRWRWRRRCRWNTEIDCQYHLQKVTQYTYNFYRRVYQTRKGFSFTGYLPGFKLAHKFVPRSCNPLNFNIVKSDPLENGLGFLKYKTGIWREKWISKQIQFSLAQSVVHIFCRKWYSSMQIECNSKSIPINHKLETKSVVFEKKVASKASEVSQRKMMPLS